MEVANPANAQQPCHKPAMAYKTLQASTTTYPHILARAAVHEITKLEPPPMHLPHNPQA
jgi:hypothetical protein